MMAIKNSTPLIFVYLTLFLVSCNSKKSYDLYHSVDSPPLVDGVADACWSAVKPAQLHYYYGEQPQDSSDFCVQFRALQNDDYLYFFVEVADQVKYSHIKPTEPVDLPLWNLEHYDRVSVLFDSDNDGKIIPWEHDLSISVNYGIDSVIISNANSAASKIDAAFKDAPGGYNAEFKIPIHIFTKTSVAFNVVATDHDKKFHKDSMDVFGIWESEFGWGQNGYMEDIAMRYGYLSIDGI